MEAAGITVEPPARVPGAESLRWGLDPRIDYLNHGCYGARIVDVIEEQRSLRDQFEREPIEWLHRRRNQLIYDAKIAVGAFLGMDPADFGFVTNATTAIGAVLRSLPLGPGDAVLSTSHGYNAVRQTLSYLAGQRGFDSVEMTLPMPTPGPEAIIAAYERALTDHTRLVILDHVTSPSGLRLPVESILRMCDRRGIDVLIDGAHAAGAIELDVAALNAAYYAGNLHKWTCAPVGAGFLWVRADRQESIHPLTVSHFYGQGLAAEFNWQGTRDMTPWIAAPRAIATLGRLGWDAVRRHNHELATWAQQMLCDRWQVPPTSPVDGSMLSSMATVQLPQRPPQFQTIDDMEQHLHDEHRFEVPVIPWHDGRWFVRVSCQVYNSPEQYERLAAVVPDLLR